MLELINQSNSHIFDELAQDYEDEFSSTSGKKEKSRREILYRRRLAHSKCRLLLERRLPNWSKFFGKLSTVG
jgi:hypothetical protein